MVVSPSALNFKVVDLCWYPHQLWGYHHESTTLKFKADEDTTMNQPL
jgi:hypothetical protein